MVQSDLNSRLHACGTHVPILLHYYYLILAVGMFYRPQRELISWLLVAVLSAKLIASLAKER